MTQQTREEAEAQAQFDRASSYQTVWLNDVFRYRDKTRRLFRSGTRLGVFDILWILTIILVFNLIMFGLSSGLGLGSIIFFSPMVFMPISFVVGWWGGRRMAHISPLRRVTGEGTSTWLGQNMKKTSDLVRSRVVGDVAYNVAQSWDKENQQYINVDAKEWLGSAPARRAPSFSSEDGNVISYVDLRPLGEQRAWE